MRMIRRSESLLHLVALLIAQHIATLENKKKVDVVDGEIEAANLGFLGFRTRSMWPRSRVSAVFIRQVSSDTDSKTLHALPCTTKMLFSAVDLMSDRALLFSAGQRKGAFASSGPTH